MSASQQSTTGAQNPQELDDVKPITLKTLNDFWLGTMMPALDEKFVTKDDLKAEFEKYDKKMDKRFEAVDLRMDRMEEKMDQRTSGIDARFNETNTSIRVVGAKVSRVEQKLDDHIDYTKYHLDSHLHKLHQIQGIAVADGGEDTYHTKQMESDKDDK